MKEISSTKNPIVKETVLLLEKARHRKETGFFVCEGLNEICLLIKGNYALSAMFFCPQFISVEELEHMLPPIPDSVDFYQVSESVMQKIAYRSGVKNAVAVASSKQHGLKELNLPDGALVLVVEKVEKPGNLGAVLRTADAAGVDAVIICDEACDLYNPNAIRSSVGCAFTTNVAISTVEETLTFLKEKSFKVFTTIMENAQSIYQQDFTGNVAIVFGTENSGLSSKWEIEEAVNINIPMFGEVDSLNVSNAAAIISFEATRQRKKLQ